MSRRAGENAFLPNDDELEYRNANTFSGQRTSTHDSRGENFAHHSIKPVAFNGLLTNKLLMALPGEDFAHLLSYLEPVSLSEGEYLYSAGKDIRDVYFPESAVLSHLCILGDGSKTEVAVTGREGMTGISSIFDSPAPRHWTQVIIGGIALRMSAEALKQEFARGKAMQRLLLAYASARIAQLSLCAVCNGRHQFCERVSNWLLQVHDRVGDDQLPFTHEMIEHQFGSRRDGVKSALNSLQDQQLITYSRSQIRIINRQGLEQAACECYQTLRRLSLTNLQPQLI